MKVLIVCFPLELLCYLAQNIFFSMFLHLDFDGNFEASNCTFKETCAYKLGSIRTFSNITGSEETLLNIPEHTS